MEKLFKLKEKGSDVKTEILAGITTFLAMAYILGVNPSILSASGMSPTAVFTARKPAPLPITSTTEQRSCDWQVS